MTSIDLSTSDLGLPLKNPLVASASPLSRWIDQVPPFGRRGSLGNRAILPV
ncbi:MAG TPA: hypothetical protein VFV38_09305 [Ktedonobacteraceae bacterium]|nr:hypothetical protein [Ktedonobacteraceae bacterium]